LVDQTRSRCQIEQVGLPRTATTAYYCTHYMDANNMTQTPDAVCVCVCVLCFQSEMELFQENDFAMVGRVRLSRADQSHGHAMTPRKLQWQVACASFRNKLQSRVREEEGVATAELPPSRSRSRLLGQLVSFARSGRSSRRCHAAPPRPWVS